jgi:galactose mutarotase-like enzyme
MVSLLCRQTGHELLGRLRPTPPDDGSHALTTPGATEAMFNRWYAGGWQELLPNGDAPCNVDGVTHSFHGESWGRPWQVVRHAPASLTMQVDLSWPPLRLERTVSLDDAGLVIEERLTNTGTATTRILWGHHPVFGGPLLGAGARIIAPAGTMETVQCDGTSRLVATGGLSWPIGRGADGRDVDASLVQPREQRSHDLCLLTGFREGIVGLENPSLGLRVMLEFDPTLFRWLWIWQLYGGGEAEPFAGGYLVGLEPWTGPPQLSRGIAAGHALELEPGVSRETSLRLRVTAA